MIIKNLFDFDYNIENIKNKDATNSRFNIVYGQNGNVIHTKKDTYSIINTSDLNILGNTFISEGYNVNSYIYKNGEVIGLNIDFNKKLTIVGEKSYSLFINIPNNGNGVGNLIIKELRLICTNGRTHKLDKISEIKIPHNITYIDSLNLIRKIVPKIKEMIDLIDSNDSELNSKILMETDLIYKLNYWFYHYEMIESHKNITFNEFRKYLAVDPDMINKNVLINYHLLLESFEREKIINIKLNLQLSDYTVLSTITNYLSRKIENRKSKTPTEILFIKTNSKLANFNISECII